MFWMQFFVAPGAAGSAAKVAYTNCVLSSQSHYVSLSRAVRHFYLTEFEIWTGFGLVGSTENCLTYY